MRRKERDWSGLTEETAREYYLENYEGMSRTEVQKEDSGFYQKLSKEGLLDILPEDKRRAWSGLTEETAREYYLENYEGQSRNEVQKEDSGFYQKLRKEGWLDILPESKYRDWSGLTEDSAREYYLDNHEGMSRGEVEKEDSGFYTTIYKEGWIDVVFRPFHNMEEFNEYLGESGLLEDLFDEDTMVKDVDKFSEIVKEYFKYNCQSMASMKDELGIKSLASKLNLKKTEYKFHPEEIEKVHKYMQNPANDRWIEYSLESKL